MNSSATPDESPCGVCESRAIFDRWMDINLCPACGAHETMKGWQKRDVKAKIVAQSRAKQLKLFLIGDGGS